MLVMLPPPTLPPFLHNTPLSADNIEIDVTFICLEYDKVGTKAQ